MKRYRVEVANLDGADHGAKALEDRLNQLADEGWDLLAVIPTVAATSVRALMGAASADTSQVALVLQRTRA